MPSSATNVASSRLTLKDMIDQQTYIEGHDRPASRLECRPCLMGGELLSEFRRPCGGIESELTENGIDPPLVSPRETPSGGRPAIDRDAECFAEGHRMEVR